jgi:predicted lactoylglutathione lyase
MPDQLPASAVANKPLTGDNVFINLPVRDLAKSMEFFRALGYRFNAQFTNEMAACLVISEHVYAMLLTHPFFDGFATKPRVDARQGTEVMIALSCESREGVDEMVRRATAAGATTPKPPVDHGFMYQHGFDDLDGHVWEVFYMDPSHVQPE